MFTILTLWIVSSSAGLPSNLNFGRFNRQDREYSIECGVVTKDNCKQCVEVPFAILDVSPRTYTLPDSETDPTEYLCHRRDTYDCCQCVSEYCTTVLKANTNRFLVKIWSDTHVYSTILVIMPLVIQVLTQTPEFRNQKLHTRCGNLIRPFMLIWVIACAAAWQLWVHWNSGAVEINPPLWDRTGKWSMAVYNFDLLSIALVHAVGACVTKQNFKEHGKTIITIFRISVRGVLLNAMFHLKDLYKIVITANSFTSFEIGLLGGCLLCIIFFAVYIFEDKAHYYFVTFDQYEWKIWHLYHCYLFLFLFAFTFTHVIGHTLHIPTVYVLGLDSCVSLVFLAAASRAFVREYKLWAGRHKFQTEFLQTKLVPALIAYKKEAMKKY